MHRPSRQDNGWAPFETLPRPSGRETRTVWLLPRDERLLPRQWVLAVGVDVPTDQFSHWREDAKS
jgi:hypothetical protein